MFPGNTQISVYLQLTWDTLIRTYQVIKFKVLKLIAACLNDMFHLNPVLSIYSNGEMKIYMHFQSKLYNNFHLNCVSLFSSSAAHGKAEKRHCWPNKLTSKELAEEGQRCTILLGSECIHNISNPHHFVASYS